jgi:hypothetical protein
MFVIQIYSGVFWVVINKFSGVFQKSTENPRKKIWSSLGSREAYSGVSDLGSQKICWGPVIVPIFSCLIESITLFIVDPIRFIQGDATTPQVEGNLITVHICNDRGAWGGGFGKEPQKTPENIQVFSGIFWDARILTRPQKMSLTQMLLNACIICSTVSHIQLPLILKGMMMCVIYEWLPHSQNKAIFMM